MNLKPGIKIEQLMTPEAPERVTFPCEYPIKVMVRADPGVRSQVDAIIERHEGPVDPSTVTERSSAQNRFMGITYVIRATGEAQIAGLFEALKLCPQVLLVL
jgi:putative lipoic acid-binding regulatory protein